MYLQDCDGKDVLAAVMSMLQGQQVDFLAWEKSQSRGIMRRAEQPTHCSQSRKYVPASGFGRKALAREPSRTSTSLTNDDKKFMAAKLRSLELFMCRSSEGPNVMFIVAETVQHFITTMDSVKLNMLAVDQVMPTDHSCAITLEINGDLPLAWLS